MLFGVDFDAGGAQGKEALLVPAEVVDHLFGVEGAGFGHIDRFERSHIFYEINIIEIEHLYL